MFNKLRLKNTDDQEVLNVISSIKSRATGSDNININITHLFCLFIVSFVTHIVEKQTRDHLNEYQLLPIRQSGFRGCYSCDIIRGWDENKISVLILFDFSKALDMLNHAILVSILHFVGFSNTTIEFFRSFLSDRELFKRSNI